MQEKKVNIVGIIILGVIAVLVLGFVGIRILPFYLGAQKAGEDVGGGIGKLVGLANGSYEGISEGLEEGYDAGREDGLSAEDTDVEFTTEVVKVGQLDVMSAEVELVDDLTVGSTYEAIIVYHGSATFSIDLTEADITVKGNEVIVSVPTPACEFTIDESATEVLAEKKTFAFIGSTQGGYEAYNNSVEEIAADARDKMLNYDVMIEQAQEAARGQVEILVKSAKGNDVKVTVVFDGKEGLLNYAK